MEEAWAAPSMAGADAAAGVPPRSLRGRRCREPGGGRVGRDTAIPADQIELGGGVNLGRGSSGARTCKTRALAAPGARMVTDRQNALVSKEALMQKKINRARLSLVWGLVDMMVCPEGEVLNTDAAPCQIWS